MKTVVGAANGWTQLAFNTYGTGTGKTIPGGGASTKALQDAAFRDALGYAVDHKTLIDRVLGGFGDPGDTIVPPVLGQWHVTPDKPRTFDIEKAKTLLDVLTVCNKEDKHGKTSHLKKEEIDDLVEFLKSLPYEKPPDETPNTVKYRVVPSKQGAP